MSRDLSENPSGRRRQGKRRLVWLLVMVIVFFVVGFVLPTVFTYAAVAISGVLGASTPSADMPRTPMGFPLTMGALMAAGAGLGFLLKWAERSLGKRRETEAQRHTAPDHPTAETTPAACRRVGRQRR